MPVERNGSAIFIVMLFTEMLKKNIYVMYNAEQMPVFDLLI